jgi:hypothetical protein
LWYLLICSSTSSRKLNKNIGSAHAIKPQLYEPDYSHILFMYPPICEL